MAHPSHRRGTGGRHRATVMCVLFAVFFVLGDLYCTLVHAQQQVRGLAELESGSLPQAGQSLNSRYNTREAVNKEGIFGEKGLQARADHEVMNMETVAHSGATSFNWKAEDNPPIESGSSSFAATSESSAVEGSSSFHSGSGSSSFAGSSHSSSTSSSSEANKEKQPGEGVADMTLTNTVTTASSETPTAKRPAKDHGMGTALVLFFVILFIVALIMYGGRRCRSACPFVGQNGGGSGSRPYSFFQQQRLRYSTLRSDNGAYLGMEPSSVAAGVPAGGRKLGRFFQSQRGGGDNEGYSDISVELKENPKTVRGAGARRSGDAADSFSHIVDNNSATKNELFHSSASSAGPVSVQIPTQSKTSLKSLRKGKLGQVSTTPAASFFSGSTTEASGPNTRSSLYRSTADTRSGHADAAAMPPTRTQPRVENDWEW